MVLDRQMGLMKIFMRLCLVGNVFLVFLWLHSRENVKNVSGTATVDRKPLFGDDVGDGFSDDDEFHEQSEFDKIKQIFIEDDADDEKIDSEWIAAYKERHPHGTDPVDAKAKPVTITGWTSFQPASPFWFQDGVFSRRHCPNLYEWMKCEYIPTVSLDVLHSVDAVLFHAKSILASNSTPPSKPVNQKWIFYETEAPTNLWTSANISADYWTLFNVSATFTFDADIPVHHHRFFCQDKVDWKSPGINYAAKKTKKIAWFVSHCKTSSRRELYVEELQKYIDVDIFGYCGSEACKKNMDTSRDCMKELLDDYKFYLSFENSFCEEYATEKLSRFLSYDILQIVLGSYDYSNILPQGSFLDVRDFSSPKQLAEYLHKLDKDDELYNSYIDKKNSVECTRRKSMNFYCMLCDYLHSHRYEQQEVHDVRRFWSVERRCTSPIKFYENVADEIIPHIEFTSRPDVFL